MREKERPWQDEEDSSLYDRRDAALLFDRTRRDLLAVIAPNSVEPYAYLYDMVYHPLNELENQLCLEEGKTPPEPGERIADDLLARQDRMLILSASGRGKRAQQAVEVLRRALSDDDAQDRDFDTEGRGLKHG